MTKRKNTRRIVVHCLLTDPSWHGPVSVDEVRRWHMDERGWADVGYHAIIRHSGAIEIGRDEGAVGAHAVGYNLDSLAVALEGGCDIHVEPRTDKLTYTETDRHFTSMQFRSLEAWIKGKLVVYPEITEICGHRDIPGVTKFCPSFDVRKWWLGVERRAAQMALPFRKPPLGIPIED